MRSSRCGICVVVISALLCSLAAAAFADVIAIRVGVYDNAPKIYTNTDGTVSGFWPDLIRQIAAEEGWEIEWLVGSWSQCLERLEAGAIDILPDTGWTEPRSLKYAFTQETVLVSWSRLYVPQDSDIKSIIDLDGKSVAALRGSFNLDGPEGIRELAQAFDLDVTFLEMESYEQVFEALEKGEVDAGVTNKDFGNQHEDSFDVERTPIIFQPARIQFALPKDAPLTPYLIERIDVNVKAFKQDNASAYYQALAEHIGSQEAGVHIEFIPRWARMAVLAGGGVLLFLLAVGITSRLQVRHRTSELRESEARFRTITEHSADAIFITDQQGAYTYVNQAASDLLGYSKEELVAMSILDVTPEGKADQARQTHMMLQQHGHLYIAEITLRKRDGSFVPVDLNAVVLPTGSVYSSFRDITERISAEKVEKHRSREWQTTFDSVADAICLLDTDQRILRANRAMEKLLTTKPDEIVGKHCWEVVHHTESPIDGCPLVRMSHTLQRESMLLPLDDRVFEVMADPILNEESRTLVGAVHLMRDITDRVHAEEEKLAMMAQLRQSQKLESIGTLASGVAHEINNPLMGMMNYAELVKDKTQDPKSIEYLKGIGVEGNRIAKIVRNLLSFSRQDKEEQSPARIADIIDSSLSLVGSLLRKDQIAIEIDIAEDLPQLTCRSQQIQQVVINLLTNAHAALNERYPEYDEDKLIRITAQLFEQGGEDWLRTTVEDHGIGIPEAVAQRIFDPFFTTKPRPEGTGLGLSVSFGIVREHHGELLVESVPGEPTRFHMDLRVNNG